MAKFLGAVRFTDGNLMWFIWNGTVDLARPKLFASPEAAGAAWDDPQNDAYDNCYRPGGELVDVMPLYGLDNPEVYFQSRADRDGMLLIGPLCFDRALEEQRLGERILDAEARASKWLTDANEARKRGDVKLASECDAKSQYWRGQFNLLTGQRDRPAPKN